MDGKPAVVKAVLGELVYEANVEGNVEDTLYAYPCGYGSSWREGEDVNIQISREFPKYPTSSVCEVEIEESARPGYLVTRARQVDTSNPENGFYGDWYEC